MVSSIVEWVADLARSPWFYVIVFVVALLDSILPVVPSETVVIIGGVSAANGDKWLLGVILLAALGAIIGDNISYLIGRKAGKWLERRRQKRRKQSRRLDAAAKQLEKRGGMLILTARFIPGGRTAVTVMSGVTHQRWLKFLFFTVIAGAVWATYAALLGYFGGRRFQDNHTAAFLLAFGMAISVSLLIEIIRWTYHRRHPAEFDESNGTDEPATA